MASSTDAQRKGLALVMSLYRQVLRLHRERLPPPMRNLGDSYANAEFKAHLRAKSVSQAQWQGFFEQWTTYTHIVRGEAVSTGTDSMQATLDSLNDEQRKRLEELKQEIQSRAELDRPAPPQPNQ